MGESGASDNRSQAIEAAEFEAWQAESRAVDRLRPVFIVGPPRCGTTWLLASLMGHPAAVGVWCETHAASVLLPELRRAVQTHNQTLDQWRQAKAPRFSERDALLLERQAFDRVIIGLLKRAGRLHDPTVEAFVEKSPTHAQHVDRLARLYPQAKFIIASRDVRDAAVSWWFHCQQRYAHRRREDETLMTFAEHYARREWAPRLRAARRAGETIGPQRCIEIDYAEHKVDPEAVTTRALRLIGLDASPEHAQACVQAGSFRRLSYGRRPGEEAEHFYRKGVVGDWANHMTPEQGDRLLEIARQALGAHTEPVNIEHVAAPAQRA